MEVKAVVQAFDARIEDDWIHVSVTTVLNVTIERNKLPSVRLLSRVKYPKKILSALLTRDSSQTNALSAETGT